MSRRRIATIGAGLILLVGGAAGGSAAAFAGGDGDELATGAEAESAIAAALDHLGGGTTNEVEFESEQGASYEVEVTKPNGETVDVLLDGEFNVILVESDSDEGGARADDDD